MNDSHSDATGGNSDDDRIQICPDCGQTNPYRRLFGTHSPSDDRHAEHRFACRSCGATFDEPDSRPRMKGGNSGVHGLAADLLKTDEDDIVLTDGGTTEDSGGDWFHDDDRGPLERHVYRVEASGTSVGEVDRIEIEVAPQQKLGSQDHATVRYQIDGDHAVLQRVLGVSRLEDQLKAIAIAQAIVTRHDAVATVQSVGQRQAELAEEIHGLTIDREAKAGSNEHANVVNAQLRMAERNGTLPDNGGEE
jgi:hypothetical protein